MLARLCVLEYDAAGGALIFWSEEVIPVFILSITLSAESWRVGGAPTRSYWRLVRTEQRHFLEAPLLLLWVQQWRNRSVDTRARIDPN